MASKLHWRLTPFLEALRHRDIVLRGYPSRDEIDQALETGTVWLSWCHRGERPPVLAMDLLALLRAIDYDEWLVALEELWPNAMKLWSHLFASRSFRLGCEVRAYELIQTACGPFFENISEGEVSDDCKRIHQEMETRYALLKCQGKIIDAEVPVRVACSFVRYSDEPFWRGCLRLSTAQVARDGANDGDGEGYGKEWRLLFRFQEVYLDVLPPSWDIKNVLSANELAACGVSAYPLPLCDLNVTTKTASWATPLMQRVLSTNDGDDELHGVSGGSKAVCVHVRVTSQTIDSVMSAVFTSQSVREIHVDSRSGDGVPDHVRLWQWLAVVVFSDMASGMVKKLTVKSDRLTMEAVRAIELMLEEPDPMAALFGNPPGPKKGVVEATISASRFLFQKPSERGPSSRNARLQPVLRILESQYYQ